MKRGRRVADEIRVKIWSMIGEKIKDVVSGTAVERLGDRIRDRVWSRIVVTVRRLYL